MGRPKLNTTGNQLDRIQGLSKYAIEQARRTDKLLPHELLLCWANGIEIAGLRPDPAQQLYAAVAAAPYYQPKLANIEVKQDVRVKAVISAAPMTQHQWAQKYLNQQSNPVSPAPLPDVVPSVAYEVTPTDASLVQQNNNSSEVIAESNNLIPPGGEEHGQHAGTERVKSSESSESLDPPSKS